MLLLVGGTGRLGRQLTPALVARKGGLRLLGRHQTEVSQAAVDAGAEFVEGDVRDPDVCRRAVEGVDTVISAMAGFGGIKPLGSRAVDREGNLALIDAARQAHVARFVLFSIHEAGPDHPIELIRDKWAAEEAVRASGLAWTILRPTAYLETWLGIVGGPLVETGKTRVFGRGRNPMNFVSTSDVVQFVELALDDPALRNVAIDIPGPQNLSFDDLLDVVEAATGVHGQRQYLSPSMMRVARLVTRFTKPVLSAQIATAIVMDEADMTVDGPAVRAAFASIPMTPAIDVARVLFASGTQVREGVRAPTTG
jgi:uncharacterized protein YbjT (DUF2867 family)